MSKGDTPRPYNKKKFDENFDKIFGKVKQSERKIITDRK